MKFLKSRQGMALPSLLGLVTFVLASVATLLSYAVFQTRIITKEITATEQYANAVQSVEATIAIILRDQNLDPVYLSDLGTYMGVTITEYATDAYTIVSPVNATLSVTSYLTGALIETSTYTLLFSKTGQEPSFSIDPIVSADSLLEAYATTYLANTFPTLTPTVNYASITAFAASIRNQTNLPGFYTAVTPNKLINTYNYSVSGHWVITGNLSIAANKTLNIPSQYLLIVDGNVTLGSNAKIVGNVVIDGTLTIGAKNNTATLAGTAYVTGSVTTPTGTNLILGNVSRPSFLINEHSFSFSGNISGYGYLFGASFSQSRGTTNTYGGIYAVDGTHPAPGSVHANPSLAENQLVGWGIAPDILVADPAGNIRYTNPR